jgi:hypothetical protein
MPLSDSERRCLLELCRTLRGQGVKRRIMFVDTVPGETWRVVAERITPQEMPAEVS